MNRELKAGLIMTLLVVIMLFTSIFFLPQNNAMDPKLSLQKPSLSNPLGTDNFGRDIFSRIIAGSKYTLIIAVCTVIGAVIAGCLLGLAAGFFGGLCDEIIMRLMDIISSFPGILFALVMIALFDNSPFTLFAALTILFLPSFTRVIRSGTLQLKNSDFILAEKLLGAGFARIMFIHILPNLMPSLISASILGLSNAVLAETAMSYLGLGIQPPIPSWGRMLSESQIFLFNAPWYALAPGICIMLTVIAFHFLGEGLRRHFGEKNALA